MPSARIVDASQAEITFVWQPRHQDTRAVELAGSFFHWERRLQLTWYAEQQVFRASIILPIRSQRYEYKFVVDDQWLLDETQPTVSDQAGHINNVLDLQYVLGSSIAAMLSYTELDCPTQHERSQFDSFSIAHEPSDKLFPWHGTWRMFISAATASVPVVAGASNENCAESQQLQQQCSTTAAAAPCCWSAAAAATTSESSAMQQQQVVAIGIGDTYWTGVWRVEVDVSVRDGNAHYTIQFETRSKLSITLGTNNEEAVHDIGIKPLSIRYGALFGLTEDPPYLSFTSNIGTRFVAVKPHQAHASMAVPLAAAAQHLV